MARAVWPTTLGIQGRLFVPSGGKDKISKASKGRKTMDRPFWSIMIPSFNCAQSLRRTIESVLSATAYNPETQIEIVDDFSSHDNPEGVADLYRKRGVTFYRQPRNVGASENFNSCIARARGKWVHILHGDDYVHPDFYSALEQSISPHKNVRVAFTSYVAVNESGGFLWQSKNLPGTRGIVEHIWRDVIAVH